MSKYLKAFLLSKKNNKNHKLIPKPKYKPAEKNINFSCVDSITYNLIESMTMYKNKEITKNNLNIMLFSNLSLFLCKGESDQKKIKKIKRKENKENNDIKKCSIQNFGIFYPTKRVTCLEATNNNKNDNNIKIPLTYKYFRTFYPLGRNFLNIKIKADYDATSYKKKNNTSFQGSNDSNNMSLVSEESLISNKEIIGGSNKEIYDMNNKKVFRNLKIFKKYRQLVDYIECPLIKEDIAKEEYNNFIKLLESVDDLFENNYNDIDIINNIINENIYLNEENNINNYIFDYNNKKVFIDDIEIFAKFHSSSNINLEQIKNKNLSPIINEDKKNKSANISKFINGDLLLNSTMKNELNETMDKTSISKNITNIKSLNNKNDKSLEISTSLKKKYLKRMNEAYISLIHDIYMDFISKCLFAKNSNLDSIMIKKFFVQLFKSFLLKIDICNKKVYEKILKNQIFSNKILTFDQFIQCFDTILYDNENENLKAKFLFLFNILPLSNNDDDDDDFLNSKKIELFFDMLGCSPIYINNFCEILGERLVVRFNAVYKNNEEKNISNGKYRFKKMKIILESFFDNLQIED